MDLGRARTVSEIIKNFGEVFALIVAGLWAYTQFLETESPSLEIRGFSESALNWYQTPEFNHCLGQFGVSIRNIGKKSFNISNGTIRVWLVDPPPSGQLISYLDPKQFSTEKPFFEKSFTDAKNLRLLGHFPPNVVSQYDFTFNFEKMTSKFALFSFDGNGSEIEIHEARWSYVCDIDKQHSR